MIKLMMENGRKELIIFCDGGNRLKSSNHSAFSSVVLTEDMNVINEDLSITESFYGATNNQMELLGFLSTITNVFENYETINPDNSPLTITVVSDSQYLVKGVNEHMEGWLKRGWKLYSGKPVKNMDIWKAIKHILDLPKKKGLDIEYNFMWTKGHVALDGNESYATKYNNECDDRLNEAMDSYNYNNGDYERYVKDLIGRVYGL